MALYRTARGKQVDMIKLVKQNEMAIAVGNAKVNARGDKLGPGGTIAKRREEIVSGTVPDQMSIREPAPTAETPQPEIKTIAKPKNIKDQDPEGNE